MLGPEILTRSMSRPAPVGPKRELWQYHSRSDRHSKISCWCILFDLLRHCPLLRRHVSEGRIGFGINHTMADFQAGRKKDLDLVVCVPAAVGEREDIDFSELVDRYRIVLTAAERRELAALPGLPKTAVGSVQIALEAKACMTEHGKAIPRFYDELNSSHLTIHGASPSAIGVGFALVNVASEFQSPGRAAISGHKQPSATERVVAKFRELPKRGNTQERGFDALGLVVIDCRNDGVRPVRLESAPPAPQPGDSYHYGQMIQRIAALYASRFPQI